MTEEERDLLELAVLQAGNRGMIKGLYVLGAGLAVMIGFAITMGVQQANFETKQQNFLADMTLKQEIFKTNLMLKLAEGGKPVQTEYNHLNTTPYGVVIKRKVTINGVLP